jgi:hypothetical protein
MFRFLTEWLRGVSNADESSGDHASAQPEHPEQLSTRADGECSRLAI